MVTMSMDANNSKILKLMIRIGHAFYVSEGGGGGHKVYMHFPFILKKNNNGHLTGKLSAS